MNAFNSLLDYLIILVALGGTAIVLRRFAVISESQQGVFGRLVTDFAMPALVFTSLSTHAITQVQMLGALLLFAAIAPVMVFAWLIGRTMGLTRPALGSVVMVSGFGGTGTLGFALIQHVFGNDPQMLDDAVVMGQFGNLLPALTVGVAVSIWFGQDRAEAISFKTVLGPMITSPLVAATVLGIAVSFFTFPMDIWPIKLLYEYLHIVGATLSVLVAFAIGLMLKPIGYREIAVLIALAAVLKLVVEPIIGWAMTLPDDLPHMERQLLILDTALPTGTIAAVIAARYGCDSAIASGLVVATLVVSLVMLPVTIYLAF